MITELSFEMAQTLRRSHCDRRGQEHECVGVVTIKRGEVCLDCPLCGKGDVNTYAVFAELDSALASRTGRSGFIVPSGIAPKLRKRSVAIMRPRRRSGVTAWRTLT